ncbi:histone-lysine N-methyltransferase 2D-like [Limulus polyphemus]|uniref:Histone-lysine N-methyltransferase 2D-like n=1 Tax=Limulus polyphemus TaxID=6850 RepID=A0ABM1TAF9_LIMPO|nr:histone-lysine N-methyltransferase 2D-like [Limulus polyphemus]
MKVYEVGLDMRAPPPPPTPPQPPLPELQCLSPSPKVVKDPEPIPQPPPPKPKPQAQFYVDGVFLSESGMDQIRALTIEQPKKQRMRRPKHQIGGRPFVMGEDKDVVSSDIAADLVSMETDVRMEVDDGEDGMKGEATDANLEKKRRQRKLHKLGIGGFVARPRARSLSTKEQGNEQTTASMDQTDGMGVGDVLKSVVGEAHIEQPIQEKPKRRRRVKKKNPLEECFPSYLQRWNYDKLCGKILVIAPHKLICSKQHHIAVSHK